MEIEDAADRVRKSRLGWFVRLERKDAGDWVSACRSMAVVGNAGKGSPGKRWNEIVMNDLKKCGLEVWRKTENDGRLKLLYVYLIRPTRASTGKRRKRRRERDVTEIKNGC